MSALESPPRLDAGELEAALGLWLRLAQQKDLRGFKRRFAESGVGEVDYAILLVVEANPGCRQSDLAETLRMRQPNLSPPLDALEGRGLIERRPDPRDRRAQSLHVTAKGRGLLARLRREHEALIASYRARLGEEGYAQLVRLLRDFVEGA